jgi:hypothetical protein
MDNSDSIFYQVFLWPIAIGRLPLLQKLETMHHRYYQKVTTNRVATEAKKNRGVYLRALRSS